MNLRIDRGLKLHEFNLHLLTQSCFAMNTSFLASLNSLSIHRYPKILNTLHKNVPPKKYSSLTTHSFQANRSWGGEAPDWDLEPYNSDAEVEEYIEDELFPPEGKDEGPEFAFQNAIALVLLASLALSFGNILVKLGVVAFSLVSAAFRYSIVGILVLVLLILF